VEFAPGENLLSARSATREDKLSIDYEHRHSLFTEDPPSPVTLRINAGAMEQFVDREDRVWEADRAYVAGNWGYIGGDGERSHRKILGTDDDPLYQTRRVGSHTYQIDVPDGSYRLVLHLAKLTDTAPDTGAFHVDINGLTRQISDLAPFTRRKIALPAAASGGQGLTIRLVDDASKAFVNGIVVQKTKTTGG
jgi:beta-galactosidase